MKQRNAMIAVWAALLIAVWIAVTLSVTDANSNNLATAAGVKQGARGITTQVHPWPDAAEVRLFVEDLSYEERERRGVAMSNPTGVKLTANQRSILDGSVNLHQMTPTEYANAVSAACFIPHHFFRYYDKNGRQIGELAVCFCCGGMDFSPDFRNLRADEEWQFDYEAVEKMLKEMGVPTDVNCDA